MRSLTAPSVLDTSKHWTMTKTTDPRRCAFSAYMFPINVWPSFRVLQQRFSGQLVHVADMSQRLNRNFRSPRSYGLSVPPETIFPVSAASTCHSSCALLSPSLQYARRKPAYVLRNSSESITRCSVDVPVQNALKSLSKNLLGSCRQRRGERTSSRGGGNSRNSPPEYYSDEQWFSLVNHPALRLPSLWCRALVARVLKWCPAGSKKGECLW